MKLHIYLSIAPRFTLNTIQDVQIAIDQRAEEIHTGITHFCSFDVIAQGYTLVIHPYKDDEFQISKVGYHERAGLVLRNEHNLEKMLLAGVFGNI